jgi:hypothetical protein
MSLLFNHIHTQEAPKINTQSYMIYPFQEHLNTHIHIKLKKINTCMYLISKLICTYRTMVLHVTQSIAKSKWVLFGNNIILWPSCSFLHLSRRNQMINWDALNFGGCCFACNCSAYGFDDVMATNLLCWKKINNHHFV